MSRQRLGFNVHGWGSAAFLFMVMAVIGGGSVPAHAAPRITPVAIPFDDQPSTDWSGEKIDAEGLGPATVYRNTVSGTPRFVHPGVGVAIADDLMLRDGSCQLFAYRNVYVFSPEESDPYDVRIELWEDDGAGGGPSVPIPGTSCAALEVQPGNRVDAAAGNCSFGSASGVFLPTRIWMVLTFSTSEAGWVIADEAEFGSTEATFHLNPPGALYTVEGVHGGFAVEIANSTGQAPTNNNCAQARPIADGETQFSSICATTDGANLPTCPFAGESGILNDVWFTYTASCTGDLFVRMCESRFDTKIALYRPGLGCEGSLLACNDDSPSCGLQSALIVPVTAGTVYKLRVGGYGAEEGHGLITLECHACQLSVPPGTTNEPESCGANSNGGCNSNPVAVTPILCGQRIRGTAYAVGGMRDVDFYEFRLQQEHAVSLRLSAELPLVGRMLYPVPPGCPNTQFIGEPAESFFCDPGKSAVVLPPGTYWAFVSTGVLNVPVYDGYPCSNRSDYLVELECASPDVCRYERTCGQGSCEKCPLAAETCRFEDCAEDCAESFSVDCGTDCCLEYSLVDCGPPGEEPLCPQPSNCTCTPPSDYWATDSQSGPGGTYLDVTLPPEFFGPGCDGFSGRVEFAGTPLELGSWGNADLRVQRDRDPVTRFNPPGTMGTVEQRLEQLRWSSVAPLTLSCNGKDHSWSDQVSLSSTPAPSGSLTATKSHSNGGIYDSTVYLQPMHRFTRHGACAFGDLNGDGILNLGDYRLLQQCIGGPGDRESTDCACGSIDADADVDLLDVAAFQREFGSLTLPREVVWDAGKHGVPPIEFTAAEVPFVHGVKPALNLYVPIGAEWVPGVRETIPGDLQSQQAETVVYQASMARLTVRIPHNP